MFALMKPRLLPVQNVARREAIVSGLRDEFERAGVLYVSGADMRSILSASSLPALLLTSRAAAADHQGRRRLYRTATLLPWTGRFEFDDVFTDAQGIQYVPYYQPANVNHDQGGVERRFAPIPTQLNKDPTLKSLVAALFTLIPGQLIRRDVAIRVGLHVITLWSDGRTISLPSPNTLHVDGEPWTAIVLLESHNLTPTSGVSFVAERSCAGRQPHEIDPQQLLVQRVLKEPLETLFVDDARVSHAVTGCLGQNLHAGWRTTLLVDFSAMVPERTSQPLR